MSQSQIIKKIVSDSQAITERVAEEIGQKLKGGEVIELIGDVGSGKTTFVRGLVRGTGSLDLVSSPTFTVSQVYKGNNLKIYHYDFYRLDDFAMIQGELTETLEEANAVVVLEWAEAIKGILPPNHIQIEFKVTGEDGRILGISGPPSFAYLNLEKAE